MMVMKDSLKKSLFYGVNIHMQKCITQNCIIIQTLYQKRGKNRISRKFVVIWKTKKKKTEKASEIFKIIFQKYKMAFVV
jgi:hypothetical protein